MNLFAIAAISFLFPSLVVGGSFLQESERYVLILDDDAPNDVYLEFYEIDSKINRQVMVDDGFVLFEKEDYQIVEDWKGSFLNDDKLFFITGSAENFDKQIDVFVMGKFLRKTIDGSLYDVTIHIHSDQLTEFHTRGEIMGMMPKDPGTETQTKNPIDLLFLIKDTPHRFQDQEFQFTTKVYDKKFNPLERWNLKGGEIDDAQIIVQIVDPAFAIDGETPSLAGNILREISGITNEYGWFKGKLPIGDMLPRGEYLVLYTAKYQDTISSDTKPLYVFERKTDSSYRHFLPVNDIERGKWKDDFGNGNDLMYDDINGVPPGTPSNPLRDDSTYVRSRQLGTSNPTDSMEIKMSASGGVKLDHQHIISYTLRKDSSGGIGVNFTVTLYDGTTQIAQWTHSNVDENFTLFQNILTRDQIGTISNYGNLSLEFFVNCSSCGESKRSGQISWAHIRI